MIDSSFASDDDLKKVLVRHPKIVDYHLNTYLFDSLIDG